MVVILGEVYPLDPHSSNEDRLWTADAPVFPHSLRIPRPNQRRLAVEAVVKLANMFQVLR
jgi:hypothetical protein